MLLSSNLKLCSPLLTSIRTITKSRTSGRLLQGTKNKNIFPTPTREGAFTAGRGLLIGSSLFGIGALCYYGSGMSSKAGIMDRALLWPNYVRDRIKTTYLYFSTSILATGVSIYSLLRFPAFHNFALQRPLLSSIGSLIAVVASGVLVQSIPYNGVVLDSKHFAWLGHLALVGALVSPMVFFIGPQLAIKAGMMTAGVVLSLSALALTAPSEQFLQYGGFLAMGLGLLIASDLARIFVPATHVAGSWLTSFSLYGGVVLFSLFCLYDTQRIVKISENPYVRYDPLNMSLSIYNDAVNLFIRILALLSNSGSRR